MMSRGLSSSAKATLAASRASFGKIFLTLSKNTFAGKDAICGASTVQVLGLARPAHLKADIGLSSDPDPIPIVRCGVQRARATSLGECW